LPKSEGGGNLKYPGYSRPIIPDTEPDPDGDAYASVGVCMNAARYNYGQQ